MKEAKLRGYRKYIVLGCVLLLLLALLAGYLIFGISRPNRYTAYSPLTGRVFRLKSGEIAKIGVIGRKTGVEGKGGATENVTYDTPEEIRILAEYFNGFRCNSRFPNQEERSGGTYVYIAYQDGETAAFRIGPEFVLIDGNWYFSETEYFSNLYYSPAVTPQSKE